MATKRKATSKKATKKDLEDKIAELEAKLGKLSTQLDTKPAPKPAQTQSAPPPPPKAESPKGSLPKGMEQKPAEPPKPAEQAGLPAASNAEALEQVYNSWPMTNTHDYKTKTPGFTPGPNRYYARRTAPRGTAPTQNWNLQKAVVTGYTACSNQYYATKARMAYHPADKTFNGLGLKLEGVTEAQTQSAPPPPPPPPQEPPKQKGTLPKGMEQPQAQVQTSASSGGSGSRKDDLEAYEADYLARLEKDAQEAAEIQRAAEELAAKKRAESASSSGGSSRGTLPKGF